MVFGISTACFYPELTEKAAEWIAGAGIPAAEVFFNAPFGACAGIPAEAPGHFPKGRDAGNIGPPVYFRAGAASAVQRI